MGTSCAQTSEVEQLRAEVVRLRVITGSDCPKCGKTLHAEHWRSYSNYEPKRGFYNDETDELCVSESDLIANHPAIAREMGVSE